MAVRIEHSDGEVQSGSSNSPTVNINNTGALAYFGIGFFVEDDNANAYIDGVRSGFTLLEERVLDLGGGWRIVLAVYAGPVASGSVSFDISVSETVEWVGAALVGYTGVQATGNAIVAITSDATADITATYPSAYCPQDSTDALLIGVILDTSVNMSVTTIWNNPIGWDPLADAAINVELIRDVFLRHGRFKGLYSAVNTGTVSPSSSLLEPSPNTYADIMALIIPQEKVSASGLFFGNNA